MEVFLPYVLHSSHCWDNYQWKWDPRLILFLILRIMLPIIWERFKGLFRLFPSHSHNYTAMVTWAEQLEKSTSCALAAVLMVFCMLPGSLVLLHFHICISKLVSLGYILLNLYKSRCALRSCSYSVNWHVSVYWCSLKCEWGMLHPCGSRSSVLGCIGKVGFRVLNHVTFFDCGNKCSKTQWYIKLY